MVNVRLPSRRRDLAWPSLWRHPVQRLKHWYAENWHIPTIHDYADVTDRFVVDPVAGIDSYPCVIPNWDNTPRSGWNGMVIQGTTPERFRTQLRKALNRVSRFEADRRIVFVKSWNEWAEGNHLEPDLRYGHAYLDVLREELSTQNG